MIKPTDSRVLAGNEFAHEAAWTQNEVKNVHFAYFFAFLLIGVLLIALGAHRYVVAYAGFLGFVAYRGVNHLVAALRTTRETVKHLAAISKFLEGDPDRDSFLDEVQTLRLGGDRSFVLEATWALQSGPVSGERARAVVANAFASPLAELRGTQFLRNSLVLGGLFGTVFFFAMNLKNFSGQGGSANLMKAIAPGLQGAMVSTLSGIVFSVILGWMASRLGQRLDRMMLSAETLVLGPVLGVIVAIPERREIRTEAELWNAVVAEVSETSRLTADLHRKMVNDARGYLAGLQKIEDQLLKLPAVQVPPQIAELGNVVGEFRVGMDALYETVRVLIPALHHLDGELGVQLLDRLAEISTRQGNDRESSDEALKVLSERLEATQSLVMQARDDVHQLDTALHPVVRVAEVMQKTAERMAESTAELTQTVAGQGTALTRVEATLQEESAVRRGALAVLEGAARQMSAAASDVNGAAAAVQRNGDSFVPAIETLAASTARIDASAARVEKIVPLLDGEAQALQGAARTLGEQAKKSTGVQKQVVEIRAAVERGIERVDQIAKWQEWFESTLLVRFLTLRWRARSSSLPLSAVAVSAPGGDRDPSR